MMKRKYGSVTMRTPRKTHTDRLNACDTWEEVVSCPFYDDWVKFVHTDYSWFAEQTDNTKKIDDRLRYDELAEQIDLALSEKEQHCFYGIVEQEKSLRVLATELECSHETIRTVYDRAVIKLQKRLAEWDEN